MSKTVVVLGDLVIDNIIQVASFPIVAGQHQRIRGSQQEPGGAGNTLIAGARMGLSMQSVGTVGDDDAGQFLVKALAHEGVDTANILRVPKQKTRVVYLLIAEDGQHVFLGYQGVQGGSVPDWEQNVRGADALFFSGWAYVKDDPLMLLDAARLTKQQQIPLFFDPGPSYSVFAPTWQTEILSLTHTLLITEEEGQGLVQTDSAKHELAGRLLALGPERVFLKRGDAGLLAAAAGQVVEVPAHDIQVVDTTGAGDVLAAAVMHATLSGFSLESAAKIANATGAAMVQKMGTGTQAPTPNDILRLLPQGGWFP